MENTSLTYAGFWRRFNAYGIDASIVIVLAFAVDYFTAPPLSPHDAAQLRHLADLLMAAYSQGGQLHPIAQEQLANAVMTSMPILATLGPSFALVAILSALYNIIFVLTRWQATPGKRLLDMRVVRADGQPLGIVRATMRHALSGLSFLPLGLGCVLAAFTREKTTLHDILGRTRVIRGPANANPAPGPAL